METKDLKTKFKELDNKIQLLKATDKLMYDLLVEELIKMNNEIDKLKNKNEGI